jgi:hypothetical protein
VDCDSFGREKASCNSLQLHCHGCGDEGFACFGLLNDVLAIDSEKKSDGPDGEHQVSAAVADEGER